MSDWFWSLHAAARMRRSADGVTTRRLINKPFLSMSPLAPIRALISIYMYSVLVFERLYSTPSVSWIRPSGQHFRPDSISFLLSLSGNPSRESSTRSRSFQLTITLSCSCRSSGSGRSSSCSRKIDWIADEVRPHMNGLFYCPE